MSAIFLLCLTVDAVSALTGHPFSDTVDGGSYELMLLIVLAAAIDTGRLILVIWRLIK